MGFMDNISAFTKGVGAKAKGNYDVVTMNSQINSLKKEINELYRNIGIQYYENYKENPEACFQELVASINEKMDSIEEISKKIEITKEATAAVPLTAQTSTNEEKINVTGRCCIKCGAYLGLEDIFCAGCGTKNEIVTEEKVDEKVVETVDKVTEPTVRCCKNCGTTIPEGNLFCSSCGTKYE